MTDIFVQYATGGRLLAAGFYPPAWPLYHGRELRKAPIIKMGQAGDIWTAVILDAPPETSLIQAVLLWERTKIDPPCFWLPFAALGEGKEIAGRELSIDEATGISGNTAWGLLNAIRYGRLPGYYDTKTHPGRGPRTHKLNSLDLEYWIENGRHTQGRPALPPKPPKKVIPKRRGRPPGSKTKPKAYLPSSKRLLPGSIVGESE